MADIKNLSSEPASLEPELKTEALGKSNHNARPKHSYIKVFSDTDDDNSSLGIIQAVKGYADIMYCQSRNGVADEDGILFGNLSELIRSEFFVLYRFSPYSRDWTFSKSRYLTQNDALNAAISFFKSKGFRAAEIDLDGILENIY